MFLHVTQPIRWACQLIKSQLQLMITIFCIGSFSDNDYSKQTVQETISPSMDISVASNFERLVYDFFLDRDAE